MAKNQKKSSSSSVNGGIRYGADTSGLTAENASELIRIRAYQFYEIRGREPGCELEDWLQAEREIKSRMAASEF